jgi:hypothetical protein
MKLLLVAGLVGMTVAAARPGGLWEFYRQVYPANAAQRQALDRCFAEDPSLNRLDAAARSACYRHELPAVAANPDHALHRVPPPNFVDLWRAAGEGHLPQSDVRAEQRNDRYIHPVADRQAP